MLKEMECLSKNTGGKLYEGKGKSAFALAGERRSHCSAIARSIDRNGVCGALR